MKQIWKRLWQVIMMFFSNDNTILFAPLDLNFFILLVVWPTFVITILAIIAYYLLFCFPPSPSTLIDSSPMDAKRGWKRATKKGTDSIEIKKSRRRKVLKVKASKRLPGGGVPVMAFLADTPTLPAEPKLSSRMLQLVEMDRKKGLNKQEQKKVFVSKLSNLKNI